MISVIIPTYNGEAYILRAIRSIPTRSDVEIIVVVDGSTDGTVEELQTFKQYSSYEFIILENDKNRGPGYSINRALDIAQGDFIVILSDDDYFIRFNEVADKLMWDMTYFDLECDNGEIFHLSPETRDKFCGSTKFIKRSFIGDTRCEEIYYGQDVKFHQELIAKHPKELYTNIVAKHYTQREGSLSDKHSRGIE